MTNRPGRNPTRRNRNIGTSKSGHGNNNRFRIPDYDKVYFERLGSHTVFNIEAQNKRVTLIVEHPRRGVFHACTPGDLQQMLSLLPSSDWDGIEYLVLRQPKRKEELLQPVWGRMVFSFDYQKHSGPAIVLEAVDWNKPLSWGRHLVPDDQAELQRLREDGFTFVERKRGFVLHPSMESVRNVQLFRTLLHEIGHWIDYRTRGEDSYWREHAEREAYAHRYAQALSCKLRSEGLIPFPRVLGDGWPTLNRHHFLA